MRYRSAMMLLVGALLAGCSAAQSAPQAGGVYSQEIGPAIPPAVEREALPILERFGYTILRTDRQPDRITIETQWARREPNAEETAAGVRDARTRVVIGTRPRSTTNSAGANVSGVTLRYEVQHMMQGGQDWVPAVMASTEAAAQARRIVDAMRLELQVKGMQ